MFTLIENDRPSSQIWGVAHLYPFIIIYHDCGNQQFCCHRATFCLSVPARNQGRRIPGQRHVLELRFVATRSESKTTCYSDVQCIWMYLDVSASFFKNFLIQMLNIPKVLAKHHSICLRLCINWLQGFQLLLPTEEVMSCISLTRERILLVQRCATSAHSSSSAISRCCCSSNFSRRSRRLCLRNIKGEVECIVM